MSVRNNHRIDPMTPEPISGTIGQIARTVSDITEAERWYRDVLGLRHLYTFGALAFFDCRGVRLMLSGEGPKAEDSISTSRCPTSPVFRRAILTPVWG